MVLNPFCMVELWICLMSVFWLCSTMAIPGFSLNFWTRCFSCNTLKLRLKRLTAQSLVVKEKTVSNGRGRPKYTFPYRPESGGKFPLPSKIRL
jgi:hypothetical protein